MKLLRTLWKKKQEPWLWTLAEGCFVPKELNSCELDQSRAISLLDVEGKIFWSITAKRLTSYLLTNLYYGIRKAVREAKHRYGKKLELQMEQLSMYFNSPHGYSNYYFH